MSSFGGSTPMAARMVGTMSITWWNCLRSSPLALIPFGQWTTSGFCVPPKCVYCLHSLKGVLPASAQPTG